MKKKSKECEVIKLPQKLTVKRHIKDKNAKILSHPATKKFKKAVYDSHKELFQLAKEEGVKGQVYLGMVMWEDGTVTTIKTTAYNAMPMMELWLLETCYENLKKRILEKE